MYIVVMGVSLLLSHTEKKQTNYFASSNPRQWEEGGHGILEAMGLSYLGRQPAILDSRLMATGFRYFGA